MEYRTGSGKTHRENVLKKLGLEDDGYSLKELSEMSGVNESTLQEVYNRGIGAYETNPTSVRMKGTYKKGVDAPMSQKLSKEQWAMARVYSFLDGNPKHDTDLRGEGKQSFERILQHEGYAPSKYIAKVRAKAKQKGLNYESVGFADDGVHKVQISTPTGQIVKFGRVGYGDFLIWTHKEKLGEVPKGFAKQKQATFTKSHSAMSGNWKSNPYSRNNLALALLW